MPSRASASWGVYQSVREKLSGSDNETSLQNGGNYVQHHTTYSSPVWCIYQGYGINGLPNGNNVALVDYEGKHTEIMSSESSFKHRPIWQLLHL